MHTWKANGAEPRLLDRVYMRGCALAGGGLARHQPHTAAGAAPWAYLSNIISLRHPTSTHKNISLQNKVTNNEQENSRRLKDKKTNPLYPILVVAFLIKRRDKASPQTTQARAAAAWARPAQRSPPRCIVTAVRTRPLCFPNTQAWKSVRSYFYQKGKVWGQILRLHVFVMQKNIENKENNQAAACISSLIHGSSRNKKSTR